MVSHIIGVLKGASDNASIEYQKLYKNNLPETILIGTILYDFTTTDAEEFKTQYDDYVSFYEESFSSQNVEKLITIIKDSLGATNICTKSHIRVLPKVLTYQDLFRNQNPNYLLRNVSTFYGI